MKIFVILISLVIGADLTLSRAEDVASILDKAEKEAKKMTLPMNTFADQGLKAAKESTNLFHSSEFQERIKGEEQRLAKEIFPDYIGPWKKKIEHAAQQAQKSSVLAEAEKIYLFFSSSVPIETMQAYITDIVKANDPSLIPVLRGWVGGMSDTEADTHYFSQILQKDSTCSGTSEPCEFHQTTISLQPALFSKYGVTQVPAVVYVNKKSSYRIEGDAALDYLLERINREAKSTTLDNLITVLRST